jgi:hypothetical protein
MMSVLKCSRNGIPLTQQGSPTDRPCNPAGTNAGTETGANSMVKTEFRVRGAERDRKNDDLRIERLDKVLQDVISEVRREKTGLRARYESSADNAIYPLDSINITASKAGSESELSLVHCSTRLKKLDSQVSVLQQMQQDLARLQGISVE